MEDIISPLLKIERVKIVQEGTQSWVLKPNSMTLLFPIPYESERYELTKTRGTSLTRVYRGRRPINTMSMALQIHSVDDRVFTCYYPLTDKENYGKQPKHVRCRSYNHGLPHHEGNYFFIEFDIQIRLTKDNVKMAQLEA